MPSAASLLEAMICDCNDGFIRGYSAFESRYIDDLFVGNQSIYYGAFMELSTSKKLIVHDRTEDTIYIRPYSERHYNNLLIELKNQKRKYVKNPELSRQGFFNELADGKYGKILSEALLKSGQSREEVSYTTKANGFKITDTLKPYLTGEPLTEKEINTLIQRNKDLLVLEEQRRNLSKEEKRAYCACIAFSDMNGVIEDYNIHSLVQSIKREFGDHAFFVSTMYLAVQRLLELKLVVEYTDNKTGLKCLKVANYKESFDSKDHYVIIPNVVLQKAFKKLQTSAIKLFFFFVFLLNNGEDKDNKYSGQGKAVYFKISNISSNSNKSQNSYEQQHSWLKKRYPGELKTLLWGSINDSDYSALAEFFHFHLTSDAVLQVRIRNEYFISKKAEKLKQLIALKGRYRARTSVIEKVLNDNEIEYSPLDLISLIKLFKGTSSKLIKVILEQLAERVKKGKEAGWDDIRSIPAFVNTLYQSYKQGKSSSSEDPPEAVFV
jgi:hypothetical protein